ncbi:MAG: hypothetical protein ACTS22_00220 [Phycisphaerales bacterium]
MKINCLFCGHKQDLGDAYDDYEGLVRCPTCGGLLEIRSIDGQMKSCRPGSLEQRPAARPQAFDQSVGEQAQSA